MECEGNIKTFSDMKAPANFLKPYLKILFESQQFFK